MPGSCTLLQARSHEARNNWEAALAAKDRAILQLEEALASRQRAVEQLVAAASHTADLEVDLQEKTARVRSMHVDAWHLAQACLHHARVEHAALPEQERSVAELFAPSAMQVQALEKVLGDARAKIASLKATAAEQQRQLESGGQALLSARSQEDARVGSVRQQLTHAFQGDPRTHIISGAHNCSYALRMA